ncbi:winged helix-turn-helix domain-containing protein [Pseudoalteromonas sp. SG41-2]|uniref:winged helix-turn-helix domain-containing protein n=1 Tax=Pseudoalteromonas sp. SG41-2 TaxID=2760978 RepID=UPI0016040DFC|nr:winged helix-turn-helix domain-containing protein [Pseudoalteromonas sp. SG41-2]MBB1481731.1 winged helix-turn-helix domain-containing protein [Pseudoalteromonas sp. SG41-2]
MLIQLGEYCLDTDGMSLQFDKQVVTLEPQVFAVLMYLIEHHERYISMDELHENLWKDRCVSDAAVRRIISKIRLVLNDDHKNPKYLQSLSKRGYKLICPVSKFSTLSVSEDSKKLSSTESNNTKKTKTFLLFAIIALLISLAYFIYENIDDESHVVTKVIDSIISEKKALVVSNDGRFIAFTSKLRRGNDYQIYLKDQDSQTVKVLVDDTRLPGGLAFSRDGNYLFFSDNVGDAASLKRVALKSKEYEIDVLVTHFYFISDVFIDENESKVIYFSAQKSRESAMLIYKFNTDAGLVEEVTSVSQKGEHDSRADISPDSGKLVVLRVYMDSKRNFIRVLDLKAGSVLFQYDQNEVIYDVHWLDDEHIVLLDDKKLAKINVKTGRLDEIATTGQGIISLDVVIPNMLFAIRDTYGISTITEKKLPLSNFKDIELFHGEQSGQRRIVDYQPLGDKVWAIEKLKGISDLASYKKQKPKEKVVFLSTKKSLELIAPSLSGQYVLIKLQGRIAILNTLNNNLTDISKVDELIGDIAFSEDEKSILYTRKSNGEWLVFEYSIKEETESILFEGYRFVREFKGDYILGNNSGKLSRFNVNLKTMTPLQITVSKEKNTNWDVVNGKILWSSHNLINTTFNEIDIDDVDGSSLSSKTFDFSVIRPNFYVDKINNTVVVERLGSRTSEIITIEIQ